MTRTPTPGPLSGEAMRDMVWSWLREPDAARIAIRFNWGDATSLGAFLSERLAPTAPVEASGSEREHGPKCWGRTSFSDEMAHCYCGSTDLRPQPSGETREQVAEIIEAAIVRHDPAIPLDSTLDDADRILALIRPAPVASGDQHSSGEGEEYASGCGYTGHEFGASYPDSTCIDGYLWDLDSCDDVGGGLTYGGDIPCPHCNAEPDTTPARAKTQDEGAAGEPVAWQRRRPSGLGGHEAWIDCDIADLAHYRRMGQETRPLYAHPSPTPAADADKLRIAVEEALADVEYVPGDHPIVPVKHDRFVKAIRHALKSTAAQEGGSK